ncbi:MAG: hypothetical protein U5K55_06235 [Aliarcobacter sp.]|nr:hypothetical protein [Aliarcobacter sp.]
MKSIILLILPILLLSSTIIKTFETGETFEFAEKNMIEEIKNQIENNKSKIDSKIEEYKNH